MPAEVPVTPVYDAGDDIRLRCTVTDQDGVPANISTMTRRFAMAHRDALATHVASTVDATATTALIDGPNGTWDALIDGAVTVPLGGVYRCDFELIDGAGVRTTVARAWIRIEPSILAAP